MLIIYNGRFNGRNTSWMSNKNPKYLLIKREKKNSFLKWLAPYITILLQFVIINKAGYERLFQPVSLCCCASTVSVEVIFTTMEEDYDKIWKKKKGLYVKEQGILFPWFLLKIIWMEYKLHTELTNYLYFLWELP